MTACGEWEGAPCRKEGAALPSYTLKRSSSCTIISRCCCRRPAQHTQQAPVINCEKPNPSERINNCCKHQNNPEHGLEKHRSGYPLHFCPGSSLHALAACTLSPSQQSCLCTSHWHKSALPAANGRHNRKPPSAVPSHPHHLPSLRVSSSWLSTYHLSFCCSSETTVLCCSRIVSSSDRTATTSRSPSCMDTRGA